MTGVDTAFEMIPKQGTEEGLGKTPYKAPIVSLRATLPRAPDLTWGNL